MFVVHAVQAQFGDCLILEYGTTANRRFLLIDGGPSNNFDPHLRAALTDLVVPHSGKLDRVVLSHVDTDHVDGLLDLFAELRAARQAGSKEFVTIEGLWHNSFASTLDPEGTLEPKMANIMALAGLSSMQHAGVAVLGVAEGATLRREALLLNIPLNQDFTDPIVVETAAEALQLGNLTLTIIGPTQVNLDELRAKWEEWLEKNEDAIASGEPRALANADQSIPNLSSICFVAEAHGRRALFTGDARSDHLLKGLEAQGLLDGDGAAHFDLIKLCHHGSDRNVTRKFFKKVTADIYVVSADGTHDNPDLLTLAWLAEAAHAHGRAIRIVATNETESTDRFVENYPPEDYGYTLEFRPENVHFVSVELA